MIMLNLFIGVIMNSMSEMHEELEVLEPATIGIPDGELLAIKRQITALRKSLSQPSAALKRDNRCS